MRGLIRSGLLLTILAGGPAFAHEGGVHARGAVKEASKDRIVLALPDGNALTIAIGAGTRIVRAGKVVRVEDVRAGERAVVHAKEVEGQLEATEVRLGSAPGK